MYTFHFVHLENIYCVYEKSHMRDKEHRNKSKLTRVLISLKGSNKADLNRKRIGVCWRIALDVHFFCCDAPEQLTRPGNK